MLLKISWNERCETITDAMDLSYGYGCWRRNYGSFEHGIKRRATVDLGLTGRVQGIEQEADRERKVSITMAD